MNEVLSWPEVNAEFARQLEGFRKAELNADQFVKKLDYFLSENEDFDQDIQKKLNQLITSSLLPPELTKALINRVDDQNTRIISKSSIKNVKVIDDALTEEIFRNVAEVESHDTTDQIEGHGNSSSLLERLMKWDANTPPQMIESGQVIRDTYRLDIKIGRGGMGEVWRAIDLIQDAGDSRDKYVAIKFINHEIRRHPFALKALVREFGRYKKLIHPNIVKAYELNRDDNEVFIVMEYLDGDVLKDIIQQNSAGISLKQAQPIIKGMCDALEYAHNEGIVHLDFKPGNVFFNTKTLKCKVIDFGIARLTDSLDRDETRFDPGIMGAITTTYASKEMLMQLDPEPRDDIYGLACVIYELLSGKHPFDKKLSLKAENEKLVPSQIVGLNKNEFNAIVKALSFVAEKRTASAKQLYSELFMSEQETSKKRNNWIIKGTILAGLVFLLPFGLYQGYSSWYLNQLDAAISEQKGSALKDFTLVSVDEQKFLLSTESQRLAVVDLFNVKRKANISILDQISQFDQSIQQKLFSDWKVRQYLISDYSHKIGLAIKQDDFDFAYQLSSDILQQYPDSMLLAEKSQSINAQKSRRLFQLHNTYQQCLTDKSKGLTDLYSCLLESREIIRKIDSNHKLFKSSEITERYIQETELAISQNKLQLAEILLTNWLNIEPAEIKQRLALINSLAYGNDVEDITAKISHSTEQQLSELLILLAEKETNLKTEVIDNPIILKKIVQFYQNNISLSLIDKDFNLANQRFFEMKMLLAQNGQAQADIRKLKQKIDLSKSNYLKSLVNSYTEQLKKIEPDIIRIKNIQSRTIAIDPEHSLVKWPGLYKNYVRKIDRAILDDQFDLAQNLLNSLQTIKFSNNLMDKIKNLADKKNKFLAAFKNRKAAAQKLKETIETKNLDNIVKFMGELKAQFSDAADLEKVILPNQQQILEVLQLQINDLIKQDDFEKASKALSQIRVAFPKNKQVLSYKKIIETAEKTRFSELIKQSRIAINNETVDVVSVFSPLQLIDAIDSNYMNKNTTIFSLIKKKLVDLTNQDLPFLQLQNIVKEWGNYISNKKNISEENKDFYRKTKNLIALRCLFNGRKLRKNSQEVEANKFFMFGLSLKPANTVRNALEKELI